MAPPAIKICGISNAAALDAAIAAHADHVGLNFFASSPRFADATTAASLARRAEGRISLVGLFVDADDAVIAAAVTAGQLTALQLHGGETPRRAAELRARFGLPVWKVISVAEAADVDRAQAYAQAADFILFDARTPKGALPGGMGLRFDWSLLERYRGPLPWGLAGGLTPATVAAAIARTGARMVDTSSGVESAPGVKDPARIAAFCAAARSA